MVLDSLSGDDVASAWGRFLHRFPWRWYCHLTFRQNVSVEHARRTFRFWMHHRNKEQFGCNYARRGRLGIRHAVGLEWQHRGAPHFHALLVECDRLFIKSATDEWQRLAGDALIQEFDRRRGGAFYLAKVYGPDERGELDLGGEWCTSDRFKLSAIGRRADTQCRLG